MKPITSKICFKCGKSKPITDFYKHPQMKDGRVNKCKPCNKNDIHLNYEIKSKDESFMEKERERGREKYKRLNYKDRQKELNKNKPWKKAAACKNVNRDLKTPKGYECHHWSYSKKHLRDVIVLNRKAHKRAHKFLTLDESLLLFKTNKGVLLDSKTKHIQYLLDVGVFNI